MNKPANERIWEIDVLRGLALLLMIVYHLCYDLSVFFHMPINYQTGVFSVLGKTAAMSFILVAGISTSFSRHNFKRGLKLIAWGMVIFTVMYVTVPGANIIFGILHFLGVCLVLYPVYKNIQPLFLFFAGALIWLGGQYTYLVSTDTNWLAPLGFHASTFSSVDYFPLFPWLGLFLWGAAIGKLIYPQSKSLFNSSGWLLLRPVEILGSHTLAIYLLHQPIIMGVLYLITHFI